jgi:hypothetical protein
MTSNRADLHIETPNANQGEEEKPTVKGFIVDNILGSIVSGIFLGLGHFLAYKLLTSNNLERIKKIVERSKPVA